VILSLVTIGGATVRLRRARSAGTGRGVIMSDRSPQKANAKKQGQTLKEKRAAKKMKKTRLADTASKIPPTGH
jgi:hypothetical protein